MSAARVTHRMRQARYSQACRRPATARGGVTETAVPVSSLVIFLVPAALLGLVAATWPARRAARLDVLAAIASR